MAVGSFFNFYLTGRVYAEQRLLVTAYRKSYMRNRLVLKEMTLTFV